MEQIKAQRRMLICAAFYSLGCLSGAVTLFKLSDSAVARITDLLCSCCLRSPFIFIPFVSALGPMLAMIIGPSAFGALVVCGIITLSGFVGGFFEYLAIRIGFFPILAAAYLMLYSYCLLQIGGILLRITFLRCRRVFSSGFSKPDRLFDHGRIIAAFSVLLLASFAFSLFVLSL